jgi:hypothetical protein
MTKHKNVKAYGLNNVMSVNVHDVWTTEIRCDIRYRYVSLIYGDTF